MKKMTLTFYFCCIILLCTAITSCYVHTKVVSINKENMRESKTYVIESPTKAHLTDGSLIVFEKGVKIENKTLKGEGIRYDLSRQKHSPFYKIKMDSVACLKCYKKRLQVFPSIMSNPIFMMELLEGILFVEEQPE